MCAVDIKAIISSNRTDAVARRLRKLVSFLESRNNLKVLSNVLSDTVPIISQYGIDVVGWMEMNLLAESLGFGQDGEHTKTGLGQDGQAAKKDKEEEQKHLVEHLGRFGKSIHLFIHT